MHGRRIAHARGKVLGGSSSINGMIFQRGNPLDYERWGADRGMQCWNYAHCLPYFKRMETCGAGADAWRGGDGPLLLERGPADNPLFGAFFAAARQAGYPPTDDVNGYRQEGFAKFDRNISRGRRISAARAYLHPVMGRRNLTVRTLAHATRIVFEGKRATGVEYVHAGRGARIRACRRSNPVRRRDQHSPGPAAVGHRQCRTVAAARDRSGRRPARRRGEPAGSPRGLRAVLEQGAGDLGRPRHLAAQASRRRCAVACSCARASARQTTSKAAASAAATQTCTIRT